MSTRGIYCVAFGPWARACALRLIPSAKKHMPDVPIALCLGQGTGPLGPADVSNAKRYKIPVADSAPQAIGPQDRVLFEPDTDVGGRRAKLRAYELTPAEWQSVLYLDADTEIVAPVYQLFEWLESGWEFAICHDVGETLHKFRRKNNLDELGQLKAAVGTLYALQYNGGVWGLRRCPATERLMARWRSEYEIYLQRDQGALVRALHAEPVRLLVLGHEWNTIPKHTPDVKTAGVMHYPGTARRWAGKLPGRIDSKEAWAIVQHYQATHR